MSDVERLQMIRDLEVKYLKLAHLRADAMLKQVDNDFGPLKIVALATAGGCGLVAAGIGLGLLTARELAR